MLMDDKSKEIKLRIPLGGAITPRPGEIIPAVDGCPRWLVTSIGNITVDDWSKSPPTMYIPIYGHCL